MANHNASAKSPRLYSGDHLRIGRAKRDHMSKNDHPRFGFLRYLTDFDIRRMCRLEILRPVSATRHFFLLHIGGGVHLVNQNIDARTLASEFIAGPP